MTYERNVTAFQMLYFLTFLYKSEINNLFVIKLYNYFEMHDCNSQTLCLSFFKNDILQLERSLALSSTESRLILACSVFFSSSVIVLYNYVLRQSIKSYYRIAGNFRGQ